MATTRPDRLHFTGNDEADALLAQEPLALLIGFVLDQQVSVQKAFSGPLELKRQSAPSTPPRSPGWIRASSTAPSASDRRSTASPARWPRARRTSARRSRRSTAARRHACG